MSDTKMETNSDTPTKVIDIVKRIKLTKIETSLV